jgi:hypothetical protein
MGRRATTCVCLFSIALVGACSGRGGSTSVTISARCDSAITALADAASFTIEVSDRVSRETLALQNTTLVACISRAEWVAAAQRHPGSNLDDPAALGSVCVEAQTVPNAPACSTK